MSFFFFNIVALSQDPKSTPHICLVLLIGFFSSIGSLSLIFFLVIYLLKNLGCLSFEFPTFWILLIASIWCCLACSSGPYISYILPVKSRGLIRIRFNFLVRMFYTLYCIFPLALHRKAK